VVDFCWRGPAVVPDGVAACQSCSMASTGAAAPRRVTLNAHLRAASTTERTAGGPNLAPCVSQVQFARAHPTSQAWQKHKRGRSFSSAISPRVAILSWQVDRIRETACSWKVGAKRRNRQLIVHSVTHRHSLLLYCIQENLGCPFKEGHSFLETSKGSPLTTTISSTSKRKSFDHHRI
jgi:hypothetical protein